MTPNDRKYTKSHEWVKIEGDQAIIGITDHAQAALGDITYVSGFAPGKTVKQAGECGSIESVKAASDLYAPIGGEVVAINDALKSAPETVNQDPYGAGWILKLQKINVAELDSLLNATSYDALAESAS